MYESIIKSSFGVYFFLYTLYIIFYTGCIKKSRLQMSFLWYVNTKEKVSKCTSARVKQLYLTRCYLMYYFALTSYHTTWKQRANVSMPQFTREERLFIVETYVQVELRKCNLTFIFSYDNKLLCFKTVSYLRPTNFRESLRV